MLVYETKKQRDKQRKAHKDKTFCINCYSCVRPCGRTTVEMYKQHLKDTGQDDIWNVDSLELQDKGQSVPSRKTSNDAPDRGGSGR
jgi:formate hydrogenlyase subunit 6/NADH:ubiquinone oxidoreductase subunit I